MRFAASHAIIAVMALVIAVLSWGLIYLARDELRAEPQGHEQEIETDSAAYEEDGRAVVRVPAESQEASGIATRPLKAVNSEAALEVYGMVINLVPLVELRGRYLAAIAEARALRGTMAAAEADYRRMELLYRDDRNVSEQALRTAETRYRTELARHAAAQQSAAGIRDAMRSAWGSAVTGWATDPGSRVLQSLLQQKAFLVQLVFPYDLPPSMARAKVAIAPAMARDDSRVARFIAVSPQVDPALPGGTYLYMVDGEGLRAGMRVVARVSLGGTPVPGVIVPGAAVVWHAGKAWAYIRKDERTFARHEVSTAEELGDGWFNAGGFGAGEEIVVSGAQLLLSEELKFQIRNENED